MSVAGKSLDFKSLVSIAADFSDEESDEEEDEVDVVR